MISMDLAIVFIGMLRYTVPVNRKTKPAETGKEAHSMKNNAWKEIGALCLCSTMLHTGMQKNRAATDSIRDLRSGR